MGVGSRRVRTLITVVGLLPAMLAVQAVVLPGFAHARCRGEGVLVHSRLIIGGEDYVIERPRSDPSTCDGNNFYAAEIQSVQPGWRATVWILNNGDWTRQGQGIYNNDPVPYSYRDNDANGGPGDSRSRMTLCADNGATVYCGFGTNYRTSALPTYNRSVTGVNSGY